MASQDTGAPLGFDPNDPAFGGVQPGLPGAPDTPGLSAALGGAPSFADIINNAIASGTAAGQGQVQSRRDTEAQSLINQGMDPTQLFGPNYNPSPAVGQATGAMQGRASVPSAPFNALSRSVGQSLIRDLLSGNFSQFMTDRNAAYGRNPELFAGPAASQIGGQTAGNVQARELGLPDGISLAGVGGAPGGGSGAGTTPSTPGGSSAGGIGSWLEQMAAQFGYGDGAGQLPVQGPRTGTPPPGMATALGGAPDASTGATPVTGVIPAGGATPGAPAGSDVISQLLAASGSDLGYLRGQPYSTTQEQAMRERMSSGVKNRYDTMRQQLEDTLGARQGQSGILSDELLKMDEAEAQELSNVDRDLMIQGAGEQRSRLAESRGMLTSLDELERARNMQAAGLEAALSDQERQGLLDILAAITGGAPQTGTTGGLVSALLGGAANLTHTASGQENAATGGISNLASLWRMLNPTGAPVAVG